MSVLCFILSLFFFFQFVSASTFLFICVKSLLILSPCLPRWLSHFVSILVLQENYVSVFSLLWIKTLILSAQIAKVRNIMWMIVAVIATIGQMRCGMR